MARDVMGMAQPVVHSAACLDSPQWRVNRADANIHGSTNSAHVFGIHAYANHSGFG